MKLYEQKAPARNDPVDAVDLDWDSGYACRAGWNAKCKCDCRIAPRSFTKLHLRALWRVVVRFRERVTGITH
jgi:hypothetical protein